MSAINVVPGDGTRHEATVVAPRGRSPRSGARGCAPGELSLKHLSDVYGAHLQASLLDIASMMRIKSIKPISRPIGNT